MKDIKRAKEQLASEIAMLVSNFAKKDLPDTQFDIFVSTSFGKSEGKAKLVEVEVKINISI